MYIYKDICINKIKACINSNDFYVIVAYIIRTYTIGNHPLKTKLADALIDT